MFYALPLESKLPAAATHGPEVEQRHPYRRHTYIVYAMCFDIANAYINIIYSTLYTIASIVCILIVPYTSFDVQ